MATVFDPNTAESNGSENHSKSLRECLKDFLEYTTAHGCARLAASKGIFWKSFWVLLGLTAHVSFWYHCVVIVDDYMDRPVRTKVTLQRNKVLEFPVVTLCNRNMLRQSKLTEEIKQKVKEIRNTTSEYWEKKNSDLKKSSPRIADSNLLHLMEHRIEHMRRTVSTVNPAKLREMGHQFQDMVLDCMLDEEDCTSESNYDVMWRQLWIEDVGNCYMFNRVLPGDGIKPHKSVMTGDRHGLRLLINLEQYEYLEGISPQAGLKIVIASQGKMPFPLSEGINAGPGLTTSIELTMKQTLRLDSFNNNSCEKTGKLNPSNIYHPYNMTYSKMACRVSCMSNMQLRRCKCSLFHFTGNPNVNYCIKTNKTIVKCLNDVKADFANGACLKYCPPQCLDTAFSRTISTYKWPANKFEVGLKETIQSLANVTLTSVEQISNNLLEVHIYYADMDYELVEETLKYEFEDLLSNIGGQMGIWIGVSALTIAELVELFWIVINPLLRRKKPATVSINQK